VIERTSSPSAPPAQLWVLALGLVVLVAWQLSFSFFYGPGATDPRYRVWAATGLHDNAKFVFFLRHLNLYPLATRAPIRADTRKEAEEILRTRPESLVMDENYTFRSGDRGRTLLFLVDSMRKGSTQNLSVRPANVLAWIIALGALLVTVSRAGAPALAVCLVLALGSNVTATHEIYGAEAPGGGPNIFGWPFITVVGLLALHAGLLLGRARGLGRWTALVPVVSGIFIATVRTIRSEPASLLASCVLVYMIQHGMPWRKRLALVAALAASFSFTTVCWNRYFQFKFEQAAATIERVGGTPYPGPYADYHEFWHPVWCGLGDFDRTHGYVWDDRAAYAYAIPIMRDKYHVDIPSTDVSGNFIEGESWDAAGFYPKLFSELPHYDEVIRDKVLGDIRSDPQWYLTILAQRVQRILFDNAPLQVAWGARRLQLPAQVGGWLLLGAFVVCAYRRDSTGIALILFTLPLWATPLFVYSGRGISSYASVSHNVAAAVLAAPYVAMLTRRSKPTPVAKPQLKAKNSVLRALLAEALRIDAGIARHGAVEVGGCLDRGDELSESRRR